VDSTQNVYKTIQSGIADILPIILLLAPLFWISTTLVKSAIYRLHLHFRRTYVPHSRNFFNLSTSLHETNSTSRVEPRTVHRWPHVTQSRTQIKYTRQGAKELTKKVWVDCDNSSTVRWTHSEQNVKRVRRRVPALCILISRWISRCMFVRNISPKCHSNELIRELRIKLRTKSRKHILSLTLV
jgi:hypothetical protein